MARMLDSFTDSEPTRRREFEAAALDARTTKRLISGAVVPRPIGWIGSINEACQPNLAPFSFYNVVSNRPPMVMFSSSLRNGQEKDTLRNVRSVPEFTVNLATDQLGTEVNRSSAELPYGESEFETTSLTAEYSGTCRAPGVGASPVIMECVVDRFVDLTDGYPTDGYVVTIGRVTRFRLDVTYIDDEGRLDQSRLGAIARMGGSLYARTTDLFSMERP